MRETLHGCAANSSREMPDVRWYGTDPMKQCVVPRCGYVGEAMAFRPVFVPAEPYRPADLVVRCPGCRRVTKLSALKEHVNESELRKRELANEWREHPLTPFRPAVMAAMGWRGERVRLELKDEPWKTWHLRDQDQPVVLEF